MERRVSPQNPKDTGLTRRRHAKIAAQRSLQPPLRFNAVFVHKKGERSGAARVFNAARPF